MTDMNKYPRTRHLRGSRLQAGDHDLEQVGLGQIQGGLLIWEEKLDGANVGFSFDTQGMPLLQSRGHYLRGGAREAQFNLFKAWVDVHRAQFWSVFGNRYTVYGEWCFAKHTVFYDQLPHYFMEFDILDRTRQSFLSTRARQQMLAGLPIVSVPVVFHGRPAMPARRQAQAVSNLISRSLYKSLKWTEALKDAASLAALDHEQVLRETDPSDLAEGLYLKHENDDQVIGRFKFVRHDFLQSIAESGTHWSERPILQNRLALGIDIFRH